MAVKDKGTQGPQSGPQQPPQGGTPGYGNTEYGTADTTTHMGPQGDEQTPGGFGSINSRFRRTGNFSSVETRSAEALQGLTEVRTAAVEAQDLRDDFELLRFDRETQRVGLSSILVVKKVNINNKRFAVVRALVLGNKDAPLRPNTTHYMNQRIETPSRPQDVFNEDYWGKITDHLVRSSGIPDLKVLDAGPLLVPDDFKFNERPHVQPLLISSVNLCDDVVQKLRGERPVNIRELVTPTEQLTARFDTTSARRLNLVGEPVRSDIVAYMAARDVAAQKEADSYYEADFELNSVSGFVNLEYAPQQQQAPQPNAWAGGQPQQQVTQIMRPTVIITDVANAPAIEANTPELFLLAISNAYRVTANNAWVKTFVPSLQTNPDQVDMRDVGALGYLTQRNDMVDTRSNDFTDADFVDFFATLVTPNPAFMIDVDPLGPNSAQENYLIDAAFPGPAKQDAINRLIKAADNLTDGHFSPNFNAQQNDIVVPYGEINLGHYYDAHNEKRDIRDLDMVAALNLAKGDVNTVMEWYRTYVDRTTPPALRLKQRESIERNLLSMNLVITGRGIRLMLGPQFIEALDLAAEKAGLRVNMENVQEIMGNQRFMGNPMIGDYAVTRNASAGGGGGGTNYGSAGYTGGAVSGRYY